MEQIMTLRRAIREKRISIGTEIRYEPDCKEIVNMGYSATGVSKLQTFKRDKLSWKLIELEKGQLALLSSISTLQYLTLKGKNGTRNYKHTLDSISQLWSSSRLDLTARNITKADYEQMSSSITELLGEIWIGTKENAKINHEYREIVYFVDLEGKLKKVALFSKTKGERSLSLQIRPIIYLPDKILIDLSTNTLYKNYNDFAKMRLSRLIEKLEQSSQVSEEDMFELDEILKMM